MATIRDVARACGVSAPTVSRALRNSPAISRETKLKILEAVRATGYQPTLLETGPDVVKPRTLGIFNSPGFATPGFYSLILSGIIQQTGALGQDVHIFGESGWQADPHRSIRFLYDGRCDGLLCMAPMIEEPVVTALRERGVPFVLIGDTGDDPSDVCVDVDNVGAARTVVRTLREMGHRRIAFLGTSGPVRSSRQREQGYREVMEADGLPTAVENSPLGDIPTEAEVRWIAAMVQRPPGTRPTAVFCWQDPLAVLLLTRLAGFGVRVPQEISVVGFNDDPGTAETSPPLTTVRQPYTEIGQTAVRRLLARIAGETPEKRQWLLPGELLLRASVGRPPT